MPRFHHRLWQALAGLALCCASVCAHAQFVVTYPRPESNDHAFQYRHPDHYPVRLLEMALQRADARYRIRSAEQKMGQARVMLELERGKMIDVMWTMTSTERERDLLPVRIPIYKGLIGWRLLLIRREALPQFAGIAELSQLKTLLALQGHDWPDTDILRANGFRVSTGAYYATMFSMLASGRVDYFPRSIVEIWNEAEANKAAQLVVEPTILLRYPTAFYFFVNKRNTALAAALEHGLESMIADGSFDKLFHEYHDAIIKQAHLAGRRVFELDNPLLPAATPLARKGLWAID